MRAIRTERTRLLGTIGTLRTSAAERWFPPVLALVCLAAPTLRAQTVSVTDATGKVYQGDSTVPAPTACLGTAGPLSTNICAAANEFEGFQIVVHGPSNAVSITANPLTGPNNFQLRPSAAGVQGDIMVYREAFYSISVPTDSSARAGGAPDALIPQFDEF